MESTTFWLTSNRNSNTKRKQNEMDAARRVTVLRTPQFSAMGFSARSFFLVRGLVICHSASVAFVLKNERERGGERWRQIGRNASGKVKARDEQKWRFCAPSPTHYIPSAPARSDITNVNNSLWRDFKWIFSKATRCHFTSVTLFSIWRRRRMRKLESCLVCRPKSNTPTRSAKIDQFAGTNFICLIIHYILIRTFSCPLWKYTVLNLEPKKYLQISFTKIKFDIWTCKLFGLK